MTNGQYNLSVLKLRFSLTWLLLFDF